MSYALHPYLTFPGTPREAMEFYRDVFGGELTVTTFGELHALPEDSPSLDKVMHAQLVSPHVTIAASDLIEETPVEIIFGNAFSLALMGEAEDAETLTAAFDRLAEGGQVVMPLAPQMWGDLYGSLVDRFGTSWMVDVAGAPGAAADAPA